MTLSLFLPADPTRLDDGVVTITLQANKVPMVGGHHPGSPLAFMMPGLEHAFPQPPPAHMNLGQLHIDPKTGTACFALPIALYLRSLHLYHSLAALLCYSR